ncbi:hypothetical protein [Arthrobacter sp. SO3]|uniref:hypothetical protein n=1 Tax=Arthrobacter sp. SO3 TaxID=1897057 RepID=UPI001CFFA1FE|nr:hypothetical protein [Arthrobacter sp. SO3]MCB5292606.1 hypothetical protein [Arthrobacter sp. SO3]
MAISVLLDLNQVVSVPELKHFLSYLPADFDTTEDLRMSIHADGTPSFLEIPLPVPGLRD